MSRLSHHSATAQTGLRTQTRAPSSARFAPVVTVAMLLSMWAAFITVYLAASETGAIWPAFVAVPMLLFALPASYMLFWLSFSFYPRAFGAALGLWVAVMFAMTPLVGWAILALN